MTARSDFIKAINFDHPETIPVTAYFLPAAWMKYREALDEIVARHPLLFGDPPAQRDYDANPNTTYHAGQHVDAWGCVWSNLVDGMESIVTGHPLPTRESIRTLKMPEQDCGFPHGFMFLRLTDLRGYEEAMVDFAEEPPELQMMIDTVLAYNLRQADLRLKQLTEPGQIVGFGDDMGMQTGLPISPRKWRKYLKPAYAAIYRPFREAGHYVYMHSDGQIYSVIPDLIEIGVSVVNPQSRANGLDNLAAVCKGKVCVDLDLDRQMFPFGTPKEIDAHVREVVEKLGMREGGLWLKAEMNHDVPLENIEAVCSALERYTGYFS